MKRKTLILLMVLTVVLSMAACGKDKSEPEKDNLPPEEKTPTFSAVMITESGKLGDGSINDQAWVGMQKAADKLGVEIQYIESVSLEDCQQNVSDAVALQPDLIVGVGFGIEDVIQSVAKENPEQKFAVIDGTANLSNVANYTFRDNESAFLAGVAAGLTTQTRTVGFVGGESSSQIDRYQYGFQAGVKVVDPNIRVLINYTESFDDQEKGRECALTQIQGGADVIFQAAGVSGFGVIQAAGEKGIRAIGVDRDESELNPQVVLCSTVKHWDKAVYAAVKSVVEDKFEDGTVSYGLKDGGVGYSDAVGNLSTEVKMKLDEYVKKIGDGSIKVPYDRDGFDTFTAPAE